MKSSQLFRFYKCFYKEREKKNRTAVNENRKTVKLCFTTGCFIEPFRIKIIFLFNRSFCSQDIYLFRKLVPSAIFAFWNQDDARMEIENDKFLGMLNYNIYFKTFSNERNTNQFSLLKEYIYLLIKMIGEVCSS